MSVRLYSARCEKVGRWLTEFQTSGFDVWVYLVAGCDVSTPFCVQTTTRP